MSSENQRRMARFDLELPSEISLSDGHRIMELETTDICAGGAYFKTDRILPEGTEVNLQLVIPLDDLKKLKGKRTLVQVSGVVIRTGDGGMAIRFDKRYKMTPMDADPENPSDPES